MNTLSHNGIAITVESVDPTYAKDLLVGNTNNRNVRAAQVRSLSRVMKQGLWQFNGEPIRFTSDGTVLDGQHRLLAIVDSGTTQDLVIQRGFDSSIFSTIDVGAKRNGGDALKASGVADFTVIAAIAHGYLTSKGVNSPSVVEIERTVNLLGNRIHQAASISRTAGKELHSKKLFGVAAIYLLEANQWAASEFFDSLASGAGLPSGDPRLALRNRFIKGTLDTTHISSPHTLKPVLNTIFKTWNAWRSGRTMATVQITRAANGAILPLVKLER